MNVALAELVSLRRPCPQELGPALASTNIHLSRNHMRRSTNHTCDMQRYGTFRTALISRHGSLSGSRLSLQAVPLATRWLATRRGGDATEEELDAARKWLAKLDPDTIPRSICDISFSRSSGPGGQNVNK